MTNTLTGIALAFLFSLSSLVVVLFRVSPLTAGEFALPFFFLSVLIATASLVALVLCTAKALLTQAPVRSRTMVTSSLRQGAFVGVATCFVLLLLLLRILNWWIALLVYAVFVLIELAIGR